MGYDRQTIRAGDQVYRVFRGELVARHIGWTSLPNIFVKCLSNALHIARVEQRFGNMRTPHRSLSNLAHMLPGYMYPLFVQQLDHALAPSDAGIAQDLQDSLKGR